MTSYQNSGYQTITLEEAIAQGTTSGFLMTLANSLERIGKKGYVGQFFIHDDGTTGVTADQNTYNSNVCFRNAGSLRRLARELRKIESSKPNGAKVTNVF